MNPNTPLNYRQSMLTRGGCTLRRYFAGAVTILRRYEGTFVLPSYFRTNFFFVRKYNYTFDRKYFRTTCTRVQPSKIDTVNLRRYFRIFFNVVRTFVRKYLSTRLHSTALRGVRVVQRELDKLTYSQSLLNTINLTLKYFRKYTCSCTFEYEWKYFRKYVYCTRTRTFVVLSYYLFRTVPSKVLSYEIKYADNLATFVRNKVQQLKFYLKVLYTYVVHVYLRR